MSTYRISEVSRRGPTLYGDNWMLPKSERKKRERTPLRFVWVVRYLDYGTEQMIYDHRVYATRDAATRRCMRLAAENPRGRRWGTQPFELAAG